MEELQAIKDAVQPSDLLYVADSMTGQDAIKSAGEFNRRVGVTGVVLTKLDGDARGGAALSVVSVVGVRIASLAAANVWRVSSSSSRPDRLACSAWASVAPREAEQAIEREAEELEDKLRKNNFTLDDSEAVEDHPQMARSRVSSR